MATRVSRAESRESCPTTFPRGCACRARRTRVFSADQGPTPCKGAPVMSHIDRRTFLKHAAIATGGLAVASELLPSPVLAQEDSPLRPDPAARRGGTLRYAVHSAAAHFDIHQSGTVANIGPQGPMYDNLIRRDPRDGQTIIPDLAWKWDIAKDGKTYTFHLR